jgi:hypothetical protein
VADAPKAQGVVAPRQTAYKRQKASTYSYFRLRGEDVGKMASSQFTVFDFITASFAFSAKRKELAIAVLEQLKGGSKSFTELVKATGAPKSTLYLLVLSLERAGLVEKAGRGYSLSSQFSFLLRSYAGWWEAWRGRE